MPRTLPYPSDLPIQITQVFDRKWTFLSAVVLFEIGSLFCAVSPTVEFLIFGRAVAGCGAGGIL